MTLKDGRSRMLARVTAVRSRRVFALWLVSVVVTGLLAASASAASPITFDGTPGMGSAPSTLGSFAMQSFVPTGTPGGLVSSVTGPTGAVQLSTQPYFEQVPYANGTDALLDVSPEVLPLTLTLPAGTGAFYLYAGWNCPACSSVPAHVSVSATASDGIAADTVSSGAVMDDSLDVGTFLGFSTSNCSAPLQTITVTLSGDTFNPFLTVGAFGIASTCATGERATGTQVSCVLMASGTETCDATVGDLGTPPPSTPTGQVSFVSSGGGVFTAGSTCTLSSVSLGVASCSVQFQPPSEGAPSVTATYLGDAEHTGSSSQSSSPPPVTTVPTGPDSFPTFSICGGPSMAADFRAHSTSGKVCGISMIGGGMAIGADTAGVGLVELGLAGSGPIGWGLAAAVIITGLVTGASSDPPDPNFAALALPPSAPPPKAHFKGSCPSGAAGASCRSLRQSITSYLDAQIAAVPPGVAEATATNRLANAVSAKDSTAIALQTAASKVYYGKVAAAFVNASRSSHALARALSNSHANRTVQVSQILKTVRSLTDRVPAQGLKLLADLKESQNTIVSQSHSIPSRVQTFLKSALDGHHSVPLSRLLNMSFNVSGFEKMYNSITVDNLRALVNGLADVANKTISAANANTLLTDLLCSSDQPPNVAKFSTDAGKLVPGPYGSLLQYAAIPIAHTHTCN